MTLTDGDVAALARQAVDLLDPAVDVVIEPDGDADPYRWGRPHGWTVWLLRDGRRVFAQHVEAEQPPDAALGRLIDQMAEDIAETEEFWAQAYPPCVGDHPHPAEVHWAAEDDTDLDPPVRPGTVELRCPATGETVRRLVPDTAEALGPAPHE